MTQQNERLGEAATSSEPVIQKSPWKLNMETNTTHALRMAMASCEQVEHMIHAAWMAAASLDGDNLPAGEALKTVIHMAGERLCDVRIQLRKAGAA